MTRRFSGRKTEGLIMPSRNKSIPPQGRSWNCHRLFQMEKKRRSLSEPEAAARKVETEESINRYPSDVVGRHRIKPLAVPSYPEATVGNPRVFLVPRFGNDAGDRSLLRAIVLPVTRLFVTPSTFHRRFAYRGNTFDPASFPSARRIHHGSMTTRDKRQACSFVERVP